MEWRSHSIILPVFGRAATSQEKMMGGAPEDQVLHALGGVEYNKLYPPATTSSASRQNGEITCYIVVYRPPFSQPL